VIVPAAALWFVVDDDASVRRSLARLVRTAGYEAEAFTSVRDFLARPPYGGPCCLVLDVRMPGRTGLDLQEALRSTGDRLSLVFLTGHRDVQAGVKAMKGSCITGATSREAEVFALVVTGLLNKQIGSELGIAEKTVKVHRARGMEKMRAGSLAQLVRLAGVGGAARS